MALHPGRVVKEPERQPYIRWTTCYEYREDVDYRRVFLQKDIDLVPSNVQSASREALLYVFEDNEAVIKMIIKGRSPTMRHVSRTTELLLIGCSIELIWIPKSK